MPFLLAAGFALPLLAWRSHRWMLSSPAAEDALPSVSQLAIQSMILQISLLLLAWLAIWASGEHIAWFGAWSWPTILLTACVLAAAIVFAEWEAARPLQNSDLLRQHLRKSNSRNPIWIAAAACAAITEEFCYRGVLTSLLDGVLGMWPAAVISAVVFGIAHMTQGLRGAVFSAAFGLGMQVLCHVQQGLLAAILVHFAYDMFVSIRGNRLATAESRVPP